MDRIRPVIILLLVFLTLAVFSQQPGTDKPRLNHYSVTIGIGWTHYINNMDYGDNNIHKDFAGVSCKFFWEPEHRLSLGLETGYYELFSVSEPINNYVTLETKRNVVPLLLLVRMRIVDHFHLSVGMGLAMILNKTSGADQKIVTKSWSLSDYELTGSYIYPVGKHLRLGAEVTMFNFGLLDDWMYSVQALIAVRL